MIQDFELIKQAQKGDMTSFEDLLYRYDRQVLNIAASFRNNEEDAKDIYQEVFMRVYKGLKNFQFKSEFSTWLYRITTNVCISFKRKENKYNIDSLDREIRIDEDEGGKVSDFIVGEENTEDRAVGSDISVHIKGAVDTLPEKQKMAFTLKYYEGYKIKEIAQMMQCSDGTIKRYLFTATNKMREQLKHLFEN
ncbi:MAG: RNA polymerase sigma factor [Ignavibacteria bacterium]|jgi:RNA polymerase sigma-70 factor (ECF subfamily)